MLSPARHGEADVGVRADFRTEARATLSLSAETPGEPVACGSRGRLEEEIVIETQVRVLMDQYNRVRRGRR